MPDPGPGHHVLDLGPAVAQVGEGLPGRGEQLGSGVGGGWHDRRIERIGAFLTSSLSAAPSAIG